MSVSFDIFGIVSQVCSPGLVSSELITNIDFIIDYKNHLSPARSVLACDYRAANQMGDLDKGPMRSQTQIRLGASGSCAPVAGFAPGLRLLQSGAQQRQLARLPSKESSASTG